MGRMSVQLLRAVGAGFEYLPQTCAAEPLLRGAATHVRVLRQGRTAMVAVIMASRVSMAAVITAERTVTVKLPWQLTPTNLFYGSRHGYLPSSLPNFINFVAGRRPISSKP